MRGQRSEDAPEWHSDPFEGPIVPGSIEGSAISRAPIFQNNLWNQNVKTKVDSYETMAICAAVRTGVPQFTAFREALEGKRGFSAQTRLALEFFRRGYLTTDDLSALADRDRKVAP